MTMAEPRRVPISSAPSNVSIQPPSPKKPRINDHDAATVRIALTLFEPNQKKCPEFFYPELLRNLQGNHKKAAEKAQKAQFNPFSHEEAERKEVEALSKKFEEKYGKKRRRDRLQDLIDIGYGYDESDSFIDNSEAYDELVPASLNTKYGGFYINSGTLQFRQASESEDESVREKKKKSPKKIKERGDKVKKRKRDEEKKSKKSKYSKSGFTALNGTKDKKKKRMLSNVQEMLAKFEKDKKTFEKWTTPIAASTTTAPKMSSSTPTAPALPPPPPREAEPAPDPLLSTTVSESELVQAVNAMESLTGKELDKLDAPSEKTGVTVKEEFKKPPSVPEGLPPPLEKRIKEFAKWGQMPDGDKKVKLYSPEMNAALLDLYLLCRDLSSSLRSSVFSHLSSILPCSKEALVKWANRLYLVKQGERLREPLRKLKEAVGKAMPEQIAKYHAELKVCNQAKYAKMLSEDKDKDQKTPSEEEEEEDKGSKKAAGPRKKFQWTEDIRQLLCHLVRMKVDMYEPEVMGTPCLEEYLKCFLDEEVKPLWPRGWMQARALFKESRRLYPQLSSMMAKNKTVTPPKIKVKESSNKQEKNVPSSSMESQVSAVTRPSSAKDSPPSAVSSSGRSPVSAHTPVSSHTQDNSLDEDLIHNPPSLEGVSEHLSALSGRTSGQKAASPLPSPKPLPETPQKHKPPSPHQPVKTANPSVPSTMSLYQIGNKAGFTHPIQSGGAKVSAPAPSQQPLAPQTKPPKPIKSNGSKNKTVTPPKIKVKESSNKQEKNVPSSSMESQASAVTRPSSARDSPPSVVSSSGGSPVSAHTQDNSLDGDLIHNPPSLEGVSEHLSALSGRTSGLMFEFPVPSKPSVPEKPTMVEEKKKPCPLVSVPVSVQAAARPVFNKKFIVTEKKAASPLPSPKPLPETPQKHKPPSPHQPVKTANPSVPATKAGFTHPIQSGGAKVSAPAPSQQPLAPQTKPPKPQGVPPASSTPQKPIASPGFIVKPPSNSIPSGVQIYRGAASRMAATPHANLGNSSGQNTAMTVNQAASSGNRNPAMVSTKKSPRPPQKLTLMAPQDSGKGTQGVAKLLTSSMVAAAGGNATCNVNKGSAVAGLLGPGPLTILTSSYKQNGGKMSAPTALSLLSPISPFPVHVVSFTAEPSPKAGASKDAIVTGPAPGTFNHGLPRNILGGLHTSAGHHSSPIPHPALSGHLQPAQTDGAHTHSKGTVPSQMRTGRPNNP